MSLGRLHRTDKQPMGELCVLAPTTVYRTVTSTGCRFRTDVPSNSRWRHASWFARTKCKSNRIGSLAPRSSPHSAQQVRSRCGIHLDAFLQRGLIKSVSHRSVPCGTARKSCKLEDQLNPGVECMLWVYVSKLQQICWMPVHGGPLSCVATCNSFSTGCSL